MLSEEDFLAWKDDARTKEIMKWCHKQIEDVKDSWASGEIPQDRNMAAVHGVQAMAEFIALDYKTYAEDLTDE